MKKIEFVLCLSCMFLLIFYVVKTEAHSDGATPYWYPSSFIYGYVAGCAESVEQNQAPFTEEMWPVQVRSVCGCVVDALRHSVSYNEVMDNETNTIDYSGYSVTELAKFLSKESNKKT